MVLPLVPLAGTAAVGNLAAGAGGATGIGGALAGIGGSLAGFGSKLLKGLGGPSGLVKTGLSLFSGIFGGGGSSKPPGMDLKKLRADAIAAGFNPLTVLNATGGAGFNTGPAVPSWLSVAAGLVGPSISQAFEDARVAKNDEISRDLMIAQIENLRNQNLRVAEPFGGSIWYDGAIGNFPALTADDLGPAVAAATGKRGALSVVPDTEVTAPVLFGQSINVNTGMSDAEVAETRYGELGGMAWGVGNIAGDAWSHFGLGDKGGFFAPAPKENVFELLEKQLFGGRKLKPSSAPWAPIGVFQ